jgi:hypothetical protein
MIVKNHPSLSVGAQCRLLSISRSSFYYELMGETAMNLDLMVVIDKQFLVSYSPIFGQISGVFKLLPAPADRFHCC